MRAAPLLGLGLAAYALFLVAMLPASVAAPRLAAATEGRVRLENPRGTLWHGDGQLAAATPAGPVSIERVAWRLRPALLLAGRLAFDVEASGAGLLATAEASRSFTHWEVRGLEARANATELARLVPLLAAWRPEGAIGVNAGRLAFDGDAWSGEALLEWRGAAVAMSPVRPLGSYRAVWKGQREPAAVALTTLEGPLRITAQGTLSARGALDMTGEARAEASAGAALDPLLDLLGPRRPDGARTLQWRLR